MARCHSVKERQRATVVSCGHRPQSFGEVGASGHVERACLQRAHDPGATLDDESPQGRRMVVGEELVAAATDCSLIDHDG